MEGYIFEKFFYHWEIRPSGFSEITETWSADAFEMTYKLKYALSYRFYTEIFTFLVKKCSVRLLSTMWTSKCLVENYVKNWRHTIKKDIQASFTWVVLHPWWTTAFPCTGQSGGNSCRGCKISLPRPQPYHIYIFYLSCHCRQEEGQTHENQANLHTLGCK